MTTLRASRIVLTRTLGALLAAVATIGLVHAQTAPEYYFDPTWPKQPFPNNWKIGGVMGIDFEPDGSIWIYNRPNDLTSLELRAEPNPPIAHCCVRPPAVIHFDRAGNVLGSFDAPQGHGMAVDDEGFVYLGQDTVRKYDPATGEVVGEIERTPEREGGGRVGLPPPMQREPGVGGLGPVINFLPNTPTRTPPTATERAEEARAAQDFRRRYPPETPMIVGGLEEIRVVEDANELYVADNYLGGRILVFDLDTLEFKRGWGAYGKPLSEISTDDADHAYTPNGPMPPDFAGHLTVNVSNDGLVYAADRNANRIHVTDTEGNFRTEFILAPETGAGGSTGGVAFSPDPEQRFLYISDLTNNHIWFLNRSNGEVVGRMGTMSDQAGQFFGLHMIAVDDDGYIYTGEVFTGQRLQRFVPGDSPKGRLLRQLHEME
jgi:DNA-binding beta-propeller fold protein YncE